MTTYITFTGVFVKKHFKGMIRLIIEADGNFTTLIVRASKAQLIAMLDRLIPDDAEVTQKK